MAGVGATALDETTLAFAPRSSASALSRWGGMFGLGDRMDPASLPVAIAVFSVIFFALTPLQHLIVRTCEEEADAFGLNAGREPYGAASGWDAPIYLS
jgi:STE24 endopeptidase